MVETRRQSAESTVAQLLRLAFFAGVSLSIVSHNKNELTADCRAVEIHQTRDAAFVGEGNLGAVDKNIGRVMGKDGGHFVRCDLVGLLDQRFARFRVGKGALFVGERIDFGIGEKAKGHCVGIAIGAVKFGAGLHPVNERIIRIIVAAAA